MGSNNNTNIKFDSLIAAHSCDFFFLKYAQQLCLKAKIHLTNFIKKNCASFGFFKLAYSSVGGTGERSFFVAK